MRGTRWMLGMAVMGVVSLLLVQGALMGQEAEPERRERPERRQFDREAMRERMMQAMQQRLEASDEEWAVIRPRLEKVNELNRQDRAGMGRMMMGMRGGGEWGGEARRPGRARGDGAEGEARGMRGRFGRGPGGPGADQPVSELAQKSRALAEVVRQEDASNEQLQQALQELREARQEHEQELAEARASLREVLTLRQEAMLVVIGVVD